MNGHLDGEVFLKSVYLQLKTSYSGLDFSFNLFLINHFAFLVPHEFLCVAACKLVAWAGICLTLTHPVAGLILEVMKEQKARWSPHRSLLHLCTLLPLLPLCLHDRLLPWSAPVSSWNRPRESSGRRLHTIPPCTNKRTRVSTLNLPRLINGDHRWNSSSTSE